MKRLFLPMVLLAVCAIWGADNPPATFDIDTYMGNRNDADIDINAEESMPAPLLAVPIPAPISAEPVPEESMRVSAPVNDISPREISYIAPLISAFFPGGGQFYHGHRVKGSMFLAAEAGAIGFGINRWGVYMQRDEEADRLRDSAAVWAALSDSISGLYSVFADRAEFEARRVKNMAYGALAWAVGIYVCNIMDALEFGGFAPRGVEKCPTRAGLLAAVPFLGLGQLYNERPGKAGMLLMTQGALMAMAGTQHSLMRHAGGKYNLMRDPESAQYVYRVEHLSYWQAQYNSAFSRRNTYLWISLFAYIYSILDAVVDAHLSDYEAQIRLGPDLAVGADGMSVAFKVMLEF